MKDEYGNGLTADNIATLDNASVAHNRIVTQKTNQTIGIHYIWTMPSEADTYTTWKRLGKVQGVHLDIPLQTISWNRRLSIDAYANVIGNRSAWEDSQ